MKESTRRVEGDRTGFSPSVAPPPSSMPCATSATSSTTSSGLERRSLDDGLKDIARQEEVSTERFVDPLKASGRQSVASEEETAIGQADDLGEPEINTIRCEISRTSEMAVILQPAQNLTESSGIASMTNAASITSTISTRDSDSSWTVDSDDFLVRNRKEKTSPPKSPRVPTGTITQIATQPSPLSQRRLPTPDYSTPSSSLPPTNAAVDGASVRSVVEQKEGQSGQSNPSSRASSQGNSRRNSHNFIGDSRSPSPSNSGVNSQADSSSASPSGGTREKLFTVLTFLRELEARSEKKPESDSLPAEA